MLSKFLSSKRNKIIVFTLFALSLIIMLYALWANSSERSNAVLADAENGYLITNTLAVSMAHNNLSDITILKDADEASYGYVDISAMLFNVAKNTNSQRVYIFHKADDNRYYYLADSKYNPAVSQSEYALPSAPVENDYLRAKTLLDDIYEKEISNTHSNTSIDGDEYIISFSPIVNDKGEIISILAAQRAFEPESARFLSIIEWNVVLIISAVIFAICGVFIFLMVKGKKKLEQIEDMFEDKP